MTLVAESQGDLQNMVNDIDRACKRRGMSLSATKSKILTVGEQKSSNQPSIMLQSQPLEEVKYYYTTSVSSLAILYEGWVRFPDRRYVEHLTDGTVRTALLHSVTISYFHCSYRMASSVDFTIRGLALWYWY